LTASWATTATRSAWRRATTASKPVVTRAVTVVHGSTPGAAPRLPSSAITVRSRWPVRGPSSRSATSWTSITSRPAVLSRGVAPLVERIVEQSVHLVERVVGRVTVADQIQQR
jgi:hypothetical protein